MEDKDKKRLGKNKIGNNRDEYYFHDFLKSGCYVKIILCQENFKRYYRKLSSIGKKFFNCYKTKDY